MAEPHHRGRSWMFIVAFTVIIALNIGEGILRLLGLARDRGERGVHHPSRVPAAI
jgi:hypothetical protein